MSTTIAVTVVLGLFAFLAGDRLGKWLVRRGATANDLFIGKNWAFLACLGLYVGLLLLALYGPQFQGLPLAWRVNGMRITWTLMRVMLLGFCGVAFAISWKTARSQIIAVFLLGILGLSGFTAAEAYFLSPIYASLQDNLRPNGVFRQTADSSCAPAALATVLRRWNLDATETSLARDAGTSRLGTSMPQLLVAIRAIGMDSLELSPTWEQLQAINRPGVLATWLGTGPRRQSHAVALLGMDDNTVTIGDPAFGRIFIVSRDRFGQLWRNEYLPIFRPEDVSLTPAQTAAYLFGWGYLPQPTAPSSAIATALRQFQTQQKLPITGKLDPETALVLSGRFLRDVPVLNPAILQTVPGSQPSAQP